MDSEVTSKADSIASKLRPISGVVLHFRSLVYWEKPYHAVLLSSIVTFMFMLFWLIDLSILSKFCIFAIILIVVDFTLPILNGFISQEWVNENEANFQSFCESLSKLSSNVAKFYHSYGQMKHTNTKTYYGTLLTALLFAAWIGSIVHNLLLTYLITLGLALYPGLSKQDSFNESLVALASRIMSFLPAKAKSPKTKKN